MVKSCWLVLKGDDLKYYYALLLVLILLPIIWDHPLVLLVSLTANVIGILTIIFVLPLDRS